MRLHTSTLLLIFLAACTAGHTKPKTPVNTAQPSDPPTTPQREWIDKIVASDLLAGTFDIESAYIDDAGGLMRVQINVKNPSRDARHFKYTFEWFDAAGMKLYTPTETWRRGTIYAGQRMNLQATATTSEAIDWRFVVQKWQR